ncbi:hypothetical protein AAFF_G00146850 [Aldrovandia affinis]|uniref:Uncharacterized protein n=1 Tax=Aldrovandia affinis TaxID=143900 RepID=A0AAD7RPU5_9TELE|nr:hypothetical protein AAFF_G00146850 [Aldrovandia affinis]
MLTVRSRKRSEMEDLARARLGRKYLRRWRRRALARRLERRRTRLLWTAWRNQTAASVLFKHVYTRRLQERAWLTWRKRRIRTRVSAAFAANHSRALLSQALAVWKDRTLCSTSKRSVLTGL